MQHCDNDTLSAVPVLPQLDVICLQVGSFSQSSRALTSLNGSVCVSGWWSDCRQRETLSVLLTSASAFIPLVCEMGGYISQFLPLLFRLNSLDTQRVDWCFVFSEN